MSDTPTDVGILLKQERERKGISLDVVHEATKVPLDALRAIEEGYRVRTLTAFYYKSFVKIYAQYLGLDANHVVSLIPTHHPKPSIASAPVRHMAVTPRAVASVGGVHPASGIGAHRVDGVRPWNLFSHPIILKKKKKVLKAIVMIALVFLGFSVLVFVVRKIMAAVSVHHLSNTAGIKPSAKPVVRPAVKKVMPVARPVEAKPVHAASEIKPVHAMQEEKVIEKKVEEKAPKPASTEVVFKQVSMSIRAQSTTWINVRVDGQSVFQGRFKKGSSDIWRGKKKIEISAKDIGVLEFEVNGRNVGKLAGSYLKAKKVVITPEGLDVEK